MVRQLHGSQVRVWVWHVGTRTCTLGWVFPDMAGRSNSLARSSYSPNPTSALALVLACPTIRQRRRDNVAMMTMTTTMLLPCTMSSLSHVIALPLPLPRPCPDPGPCASDNTMTTCTTHQVSTSNTIVPTALATGLENDAW